MAEVLKKKRAVMAEDGKKLLEEKEAKKREAGGLFITAKGLKPRHPTKKRKSQNPNPSPARLEIRDSTLSHSRLTRPTPGN